MKRSFIKTTLVIALGVISIGALGVTPIVANAQSNLEATETTLEQERATTMEKLKQTLLGATEKEELTIEDLNLIQKDLSKAIETHQPSIGDNVEDVLMYMELQKANQEIEDFGKYVDSINVEDYTPMTEEELNKILQ